MLSEGGSLIQPAAERKPADKSAVTDPPARIRAGFIGALLLVTLVYSLVPVRGPYALGTIALWIMAILLFIGAQIPRGWCPFQPGLRDRLAGQSLVELVLTNLHASLLIGCLIVAAFARLTALTTFPPLIRADEGFIALDAVRIATGSPDATLAFGTGWQATPFLHEYLEALAMAVFGVNLFAIRLVSALAGLAAVGATYVAGRVFFNRTIGLIAAVLGAFAPVDLQMSRYSLYHPETVVFVTLSLACLFGGLQSATRFNPEAGLGEIWRSGQAVKFALAGVCAGLALYFYFAAWAAFLVYALMWLLALSRHRRYWRGLLEGMLMMGAGVFIVALPFFLFLLRQPGASGSSRAFGELFLFNPQHFQNMEHDLGRSGLIPVIIQGTNLAFQQFFLRPDQSGFFPFASDQPVLIAPVAALAGLGLILAVLTLRRFSSFVLLAWFWIVLVVGDVIFGGPIPYTPRIIILLPAIWIMGGLGLHWLCKTAMATLPDWGGRLVPVLAGVLLIAVSVASLQTYFLHYPSDGVVLARLDLVQYVAALPPGTTVSLVVDQRSEDVIPYVRFMGYRDPVQAALNDPNKLVPASPINGRTAFIVSESYRDALTAVSTRYPGGTRSQILAPDGKPAFDIYVVDIAGE